MLSLTPLTLYSKMFGSLDYRPSNFEDAALALLLLAANSDAQSTDFMSYIRSLTGNVQDVAIDRIAQKVNVYYDAAAKGQA